MKRNTDYELVADRDNCIIILMLKLRMRFLLPSLSLRKKQVKKSW